MKIAELAYKFRSRIGQKFVSMVVLVSAVGALVATIAQLSFDYREESARIDRNFRDVSAIYLDAISRSLWFGDLDQLNLQLEIVYRALKLESAVVTSPDGQMVSSIGAAKSAWAFKHVIPVTYFSSGQFIEIGVLHLSASGQDVATFLSRRLAVILATNWVKTGLVAFGLLYFFRRAIGRHLNTIAEYAASSTIAGSAAPKLTLDRPPVNGRPGDELDQITTAINRYTENFHSLLVEEQRTLNRLKRTNANLQKIIENRNKLIEEASAPIFCLDGQLRVTVWNAAMEAVTGVMHDTALSRDFVGDFIDEDSQPRARELLTGALSRQPGTSLDLSLFGSGESVKRMILSASPLVSDDGTVVGVIGIGQDVSELVRLQAADVARQQRASAISQLLMDALSQVSYAEGDIEAFAHYVCEHAGPRLQAARASVWMVDTGLSELQCVEMWDAQSGRLRQDGRVPMSEVPDLFADLNGRRLLESKGSGGDLKDAVARGGHEADSTVGSTLRVPVRRGGRLSAVLCFERSSREREWAPDEQAAVVALSDLVANVSEIRLRRVAEKAAQSASEAKSEFLARMSHELRTPLNAIIGFSEILRGDAGELREEERRREYVENIHMSGRHLLKMIEDILDISKIEAGVLLVAREKVNLTDEITAVCKMLFHRIMEKQIDVIYDLKHEVDDIYCDRRRIIQVFMNIIGNAIKFMGVNGELRISSRTVEDGKVAIVFADNGPGIPPEQLPTVVAPFGQARSGSRVAHEGAGLGLSIAKSLTELCGGRFSISSAINKGTSVTIELRTDA